MGFYGNLSAISKSAFYFDKIYANRKEMDDNCESDGVYIGRYVLVDYDKDSQYSENNNIRPGYAISLNGTIEFHTGPSITSPRFIYDETQNGDDYISKDGIIKVMGFRTASIGVFSETTGYTTEDQNLMRSETADVVDNDDYIVFTHPELWQCIGGTDPVTITIESEDEEEENISYQIRYANFQLLANSTDSDTEEAEEENKYIANYNTDKHEYGNFGRGWDSTVWQKTYHDGQSKYIMVAELNSVVPAFDIAPEAPTETPVAPYYGPESANLYYKVHTQPSWGFRIKNKYALNSLDSNIYPSDVSGDFVIGSFQDESGNWKKKYSVTTEYKDGNDNVINIATQNRENLIQKNKYIDDVRNHTPLAIYFNKNGFDKYKGSNAIDDVVSNHPRAQIKTITDENGNLKDSIIIRPSGTSETYYYGQFQEDNNKYVKGRYPDTYELSMMLPSIGQTISDIWDLAYGESRFKNEMDRYLLHPITFEPANDEENIKLRNTDIYWNSNKGLRLVDTNNEYHEDHINNIAGTINTAHDLIGMIVQTDNVSLNDVASWDPTKIYYLNNKFYIKDIGYEMVEANTVTPRFVQLQNLINLNSGEYYREDWQQFPDLDEYGENKGKKYINYIKINNTNDYIPDAIYTRIDTTTQESLNENTWESSKYYYQPTETNDYKCEEAAEPLNRQYYEITPVKMQQEIYTPNRYFIAKINRTVVNGEEVTYIEQSKRSEQATIAAAVEDIGASMEAENFVFYKNADISTTATDTRIEYVWTEIPNSYNTKQIFEIPPESNYVWNNIELNIYKSEDHTTSNKIDTIDKFNVILDSNGKLVSYFAIQYATPGANKDPKTKAYDLPYYTAWEAYKQNIDIDKNKPIVNISVQGTVIQNDLQVVLPGDVLTLNKITDFKTGKFYYYDENNKTYIMETADGLTGISGYLRNTLDNGYTQYYTLDVEPAPSFYGLVRGLYRNINNNWIRETSIKLSPKDIQKDDLYTLTLNPEDMNKKYIAYEPNKFYTFDGNNYILATDTTMLSNTTYYRKDEVRVIQDPSGLYRVGSVWDTTIGSPPAGVTVGYITNKYVATELDELFKENGSILGLLKDFHKKVRSNDMITSDLTTVQGVLNEVNDALKKANALGRNFKKISIVDGGSFEATGIADTLTFDTDQYLDLSADVNNRKIIIEHKELFPGWDRPVGEALNSIIEVPYIAVDDAGHVTTAKVRNYPANYYSQSQIIPASGGDPRNTLISLHSGNILKLREGDKINLEAADKDNNDHYTSIKINHAVEESSFGNENSDQTELILGDKQILVNKYGHIKLGDSLSLDSLTDESFPINTTQSLHRAFNAINNQFNEINDRWFAQFKGGREVTLTEALGNNPTFRDENAEIFPLFLLTGADVDYNQSFYYGPGSNDGSDKFEFIDSGNSIKIKDGGIYKIHGSVVIRCQEDSFAKAWIVKNYGMDNAATILGAIEWLGDNGENDLTWTDIILPFGEKNIVLDENNTLTLIVGVSKPFSVTGESNTVYESAALDNPLSYLLIEKIGQI